MNVTAVLKHWEKIIVLGWNISVKLADVFDSYIQRRILTQRNERLYDKLYLHQNFMAFNDGKVWLKHRFQKGIQYWLFLYYELPSSTTLCTDLGLDLHLHCISLCNFASELLLTRRVCVHVCDICLGFLHSYIYREYVRNSFIISLTWNSMSVT